MKRKPSIRETLAGLIIIIGLGAFIFAIFFHLGAEVIGTIVTVVFIGLLLVIGKKKEEENGQENPGS